MLFYVYVRGRVTVLMWAGRLSPLPEDAKFLGSGDDFFESILYNNIVNIIQYCIYIIMIFLILFRKIE